jgi:hypothetical protein
VWIEVAGSHKLQLDITSMNFRAWLAPHKTKGKNWTFLSSETWSKYNIMEFITKT